MTTRQKQLQKQLVKVTNAKKAYKPFSGGESIYPYLSGQSLVLRNEKITTIEVWKDQTWLMNTGMYIIADVCDLTDDEITLVENLLKQL